MNKLLLLLSLTCLASPASAGLVLDQSQGRTNGFPGTALNQNVPNTGAGLYAQTVTAGRTGLLGRIDIGVNPLNATTPLSLGDFAIYSVANGAPTGEALGIASFSGLNGNTATYTTSVLVNAGQQFTLLPNGEARWQVGSGYAGGSIYENASGDPTNQNTSTGWSSLGPIDDYVFSTYVAPVDSSVGSGGAAVPEPAAWALLLIGFGAVGAVLRQRVKLVVAS